MAIIPDELGGVEICPFPATPFSSTLWHVDGDSANYSIILFLMSFCF